jgi:hypothetical protein
MTPAEPFPYLSRKTHRLQALSAVQHCCASRLYDLLPQACKNKEFAGGNKGNMMVNVTTICGEYLWKYNGHILADNEITCLNSHMVGILPRNLRA